MKKLFWLAGGLTVWYMLTGAPRDYKPQNYSLPDKIRVIEAHYTEKDGDKVDIIVSVINF